MAHVAEDSQPRRSSSAMLSWPNVWTAQLSARHGVNVPHTLRQRSLRPTGAAVGSAEHLAASAHAVDLVRVLEVQRDGHHRRVGLDAVVEARPRLAKVVAPVHRAVLAASGRTEARVEGALVLRRDADVPAVGQGRETADLHVLPTDAAIGAAE